MGLCLRRLRLQYPLQGGQVSTGISGSFQPEAVATFDWNRWQVSTGISGNLRAEYALDGLLEHQSRLRPVEVMADTAGASDLVFGLFWLLGYQFSPRLADIGETNFW